MTPKLSIPDRVALGLVAGLAGTIVMTLGQKIEIALSGRPPSKVPAKAVEEVSGVALATAKDEERASTPVHFGDGTALGATLAAGDRLHPAVRTAAFFGFAWTAGAAITTGLGLSKPPHEQDARSLLTDVGHHIVYAVTAGSAYALLRRAAARRRRGLAT